MSYPSTERPNLGIARFVGAATGQNLAMPTPTTTSTTAVVVNLDASRQVSGISITALPEDLRTPAGLTAALRRAYLDAVGARLDERLGSGTRPPRREARGARRAHARPAGPTPTATSRTSELVEFWKRDVAVAVPANRARGRGSPPTECVRVRLHTTDHFADIDLDPGWLQSARVSSVAAAVLEAFQDAYTQRNPR